MPNITYAKPINGSVAGIAGLGGANPCNIKCEGFRIHVAQVQSVVSGYGDGGHTYRSSGGSDWAFSFNGWLINGTAGTTGINSIQGTNSILASGTFKADNGRIYTGSCRLQNIDIVSNYSSDNGKTPITGSGVAEGPLDEASS